MTGGDPAGMARFTPAKLAYGGPASAADEEAAFTTAVGAGMTLFDTERCTAGVRPSAALGELAENSPALIATKFPPGSAAPTGTCPPHCRPA